MGKQKWATGIVPLAVLLGSVGTVHGQSDNSAIPEPIKAPASEKLVLRAHALGAQIYSCQAAADGKTQWTLKAPEADLMDDQGTIIGHHEAGPTWQLSDGSEVSGKAVARVDSPDSHSIPWLLVEANGHKGEGMLAGVAHIQRIYTRGGQAPAATDCDTASQNSEVRIPYSADYYFYAPPK
jgi:Protein of unknown function (DUF3455)